LLLLESPSDDIALVDGVTVAKAFSEAFPEFPCELDELWTVQNQNDHELNIYDLVRGKAWIYDASKKKIIARNENTISVI
jgi:hypothetical protein